MNETLHSISLSLVGLSSATVGLTLFLLLQCCWQYKQGYVRYLSLFYLFNLTSQLDTLLDISEYWRYAPSLSNMYIPLLFGIAPSFYLYVKFLITPPQDSATEQSNNKLSGCWHYCGIGISFLLCLPYYLLDSEIKLERLLAPSGSLEHLGFYTIAPTIALIAVLPFSLSYLVLILYRLNIHLTDIKSYFSTIDNNDLSWIRWSVILLAAVLVIFAIEFFMPQSASVAGFSPTIFLIIEFCWLSLFATLALRQRPIYEEVIAQRSHSVQKSTHKYVRSPLSEEDMKRIKEKLVNAMASDYLHFDADLTLGKLSAATGVSENRLSQVLNQKMAVGFYDFVNQWRIRSACQQLKNTNQSVLAITYEVGFNSRSTFNQAFKKYTGSTPSRYRQDQS